MKACVASFGMGGWYPRGVQRLRESLEPYPYELIAPPDYPEGCPNHYTIPYAFKIYVIRQAAERYPVVLWIDASGWIQHNPAPIFDLIRKEGVMIMHNSGQVNGHWCSDRQLEAFGYTRDEAMLQPHVSSGLIGFDFSSTRGADIFEQWAAAMPLFKGAWRNTHQTESKDPRCLGSRHDQSAIALIAVKNGITLTEPDGIVSFDVTDRRPMILMQGM